VALERIALRGLLRFFQCRVTYEHVRRIIEADAGHLNCIAKARFKEEIAKWLDSY
jgi:hypothetical protein